MLPAKHMASAKPVDLAKRDKQIQVLQNVIREKQQFLVKNYKKLTNIQKDNPYLSDIVKAYTTNFNEKTEERMKQKHALQQLADYIKTIILDPTATEEMIRNAKYDQGVILAELKNTLL